MRNGHVVRSEEAALLELGDQPVHLRRAEKEIDFGERGEQFVLVALHHAADADDRLARSVFLESPRFDHRVDRLLLRRVDEAAGVHEHDVGLVEIARVRRAVVGELRDVALAVDGVLVAPERDDANLHGARRRVNGAVWTGRAATGMGVKLAVVGGSRPSLRDLYFAL